MSGNADTNVEKVLRAILTQDYEYLVAITGVEAPSLRTKTRQQLAVIYQTAMEIAVWRDKGTSMLKSLTSE